MKNSRYQAIRGKNFKGLKHLLRKASAFLLPLVLLACNLSGVPLSAEGKASLSVRPAESLHAEAQGISETAEPGEMGTFAAPESETALPSETAMLSETALQSETAELSETAEASQSASPNETAELSETAEASQSASPNETAELSETAEASQSASPNETAELSETDVIRPAGQGLRSIYPSEDGFLMELYVPELQGRVMEQTLWSEVSYTEQDLKVWAYRLWSDHLWTKPYTYPQPDEMHWYVLEAVSEGEGQPLTFRPKQIEVGGEMKPAEVRDEQSFRDFEAFASEENGQKVLRIGAAWTRLPRVDFYLNPEVKLASLVTSTKGCLDQAEVSNIPIEVMPNSYFDGWVREPDGSGEQLDFSGGGPVFRRDTKLYAVFVPALKLNIVQSESHSFRTSVNPALPLDQIVPRYDLTPAGYEMKHFELSWRAGKETKRILLPNEETRNINEIMLGFYGSFNPERDYDGLKNFVIKRVWEPITISQKISFKIERADYEPSEDLAAHFSENYQTADNLFVEAKVGTPVSDYLEEIQQKAYNFVMRNRNYELYQEIKPRGETDDEAFLQKEDIAVYTYDDEGEPRKIEAGSGDLKILADSGRRIAVIFDRKLYDFAMEYNLDIQNDAGETVPHKRFGAPMRYGQSFSSVWNEMEDYLREQGLSPEMLIWFYSDNEHRFLLYPVSMMNRDLTLVSNKPPVDHFYTIHYYEIEDDFVLPEIFKGGLSSLQNKLKASATTEEFLAQFESNITAENLSDELPLEAYPYNGELHPREDFIGGIKYVNEAGESQLLMPMKDASGRPLGGSFSRAGKYSMFTNDEDRPDLKGFSYYTFFRNSNPETFDLPGTYITYNNPHRLNFPDRVEARRLTVFSSDSKQGYQGPPENWLSLLKELMSTSYENDNSFSKGIRLYPTRVSTIETEKDGFKIRRPRFHFDMFYYRNSYRLRFDWGLAEYLPEAEGFDTAEFFVKYEKNLKKAAEAFYAAAAEGMQNPLSWEKGMLLEGSYDYIFEGWYSDPERLDGPIDLGEMTMPASQTTLYAKWRPRQASLFVHDSINYKDSGRVLFQVKPEKRLNANANWDDGSDDDILSAIERVEDYYAHELDRHEAWLAGWVTYVPSDTEAVSEIVVSKMAPEQYDALTPEQKAQEDARYKTSLANWQITRDVNHIFPLITGQQYKVLYADGLGGDSAYQMPEDSNLYVPDTADVYLLDVRPKSEEGDLPDLEFIGWSILPYGLAGKSPDELSLEECEDILEEAYPEGAAVYAPGSYLHFSRSRLYRATADAFFPTDGMQLIARYRSKEAVSLHYHKNDLPAEGGGDSLVVSRPKFKAYLETFEVEDQSTLGAEMFKRPGYIFKGWSTSRVWQEGSPLYQAGDLIRADNDMDYRDPPTYGEPADDRLYAVWERIYKPVTAEKLWQNLPETMTPPEIYLQLQVLQDETFSDVGGPILLDGQSLPDDFVLPEFTPPADTGNGDFDDLSYVRVYADGYKVTWDRLPAYDPDGGAYTYRVRECSASGLDTVPDNFSKKEEGLTVINSYLPPEPTEPTLPSEPTEPTLPPEPTEPTLPSEPTESTLPSEPSESTLPSEPTESTLPSEPSESTLPSEPTESTLPSEPTESTLPPEPTESTLPPEPTESTLPSEPSESTLPSEPSESTLPLEPSESTLPSEPTESTLPSEPTESTLPSEPTESTVPAVLTKPSESSEPAKSEPSVPAEPSESAFQPEPTEPFVPSETSRPSQITETSEPSETAETGASSPSTSPNESEEPSETTAPGQMAETTAPAGSGKASEPSESEGSPKSEKPTADSVPETGEGRGALGAGMALTAGAALLVILRILHRREDEALSE